MPVIPAKVGDTAPSWTIQNTKKDPDTDLWIVDNLADVTAVVVNARNTITGELKIDGEAGYVDDVANGLLSYDPAAADVDGAALLKVDFVLTRGGKTQTAPNDPTNALFVKITA